MIGHFYKLQELKGLFRNIIKDKKSKAMPYFFYGFILLIS